jgi:hypothetical protein
MVCPIRNSPMEKTNFRAFDPLPQEASFRSRYHHPLYGEFSRVVLLNEEGALAGLNSRRDDSFPGVAVAPSSR